MPTENHYRERVIDMLFEDRQNAKMKGNPSAAVAASTRIADLVLRSDQEREKPINRVVVRIVHQVMCPHCKELGPIEDHAPGHKRDSDWEE